ncbi:MAG TPA: site-specific integrase [Azospirillum sp.]|nr:site-specific integrase [Azospirillum sp.]
MEIEADRNAIPTDPRAAQRITLAELITRYRDAVMVHKRSKASGTDTLNLFLRQPFAQHSLSNVTPAVFSAFRDKRLKDVKAATVCREMGVIQRMFEVAIKEWGIPLPINPMKAVSKPKAGPSRDRRVEGRAELASLKDASEQCRNPLIGPLFLFALETGMRRGELINIRWDQIDTRKRTLHIPKTKNGHPRTIPLSSAALGILNGLAKADEERVFPLTANAVKLAWRRLRKRAGATDLRFHDLRHEAVSSFFEKGLSVPEVALISGHRDTRMLFRYTHLKPEDVAKKLG